MMMKMNVIRLAMTVAFFDTCDEYPSCDFSVDDADDVSITDRCLQCQQNFSRGTYVTEPISLIVLLFLLVLVLLLSKLLLP